MTKKEETTELTPDDKLDLMVKYLRQMNNRDRWRTIGGFFRSIIGLIPLVISLYAMWYMYQYGDQLLQQIAETAAQQAAKVTQQNSEQLMENIDINSIMKQIMQ